MTVRAVASLDQRLRGSERLVMLALAIHADDEMECWPSIPTIAREAAIPERHAYRAVAGLQARGLIEHEPGGGRSRSNTYRLRLDDAIHALVSKFTRVPQQNPDTVSSNPDVMSSNPDIGGSKTLTAVSPESSKKRHEKGHEKTAGREFSLTDSRSPGAGHDRSELCHLDIFLGSDLLRPVQRAEAERRRADLLARLGSDGEAVA